MKKICALCNSLIMKSGYCMNPFCKSRGGSNK